MDNFKKGIAQAVHICMKVNPVDNVVIVGDKSSREIVDGLEKECKTAAHDVKSFVLENFGKRPMKKLPDEIAIAAKSASAVFYTASSEPGERTTLRVPLIKCATMNNGRQAHMPNVTKEIIETGMCVDYEKIKEISWRVYEIVKNAKEIRVKTARGTNLIVKLSPKIKWVVSDGFPGEKESMWTNLPDGEVWTCADKVDGNVVIDGCLGNHLCQKYGAIEKTPVAVEIKNSRAVKIECANKNIEKDLKEYIKMDENAGRIGEFAIGTNIGLKKIIGVLLQDEKFPGIHFAFGHGYPESTGANWNSKAHCDAVVLAPDIFVDGKKIMKKGRFTI